MKRRGKIYTDGINRWWSLRIPRNSGDSPEYKDYPLPFPMELFTSDIGLSGHNWMDQLSVYAAADVDKVFATVGDGGHAKGLDEEQIGALEAKLAPVPYVAIRRSTQGKGRHLYLPFDGITTENHTVHATLARAAFLKLGVDAGFDILDSVDVFGAIIYIWSTRASRENRGYELLKPATAVLTEADLPGWRDTIATHRRRCRAIVETDLGGDNKRSLDDMFDDLCESFPVFERDEQHKKIMADVAERGWPVMWNDHAGYYETHTFGLKETHEALKLRVLQDRIRWHR